MLHGPMPTTLLRRFTTALVVGLLALGALVAVDAPAQAATSRSLSAKASPTGAAVSGTVTISGTLTKSPKGSKVTIQRKSGSTWVTAKTTKTTTSAGAYSGKVKLPAKVGTYSFRAVADAKGSLKKATSKTVKVKALTPVSATITASPTRLKAGATAKVTGSVKPFVKNTTVTIQRFVNGKYVSTGATAKLSGSGKFSRSLVIKDGSVLRVSVPRAGRFAPGVSAPTAVLADPVISSTSLPTARRTVAYSAQVVQVGTAAGTWTVTPALPAGLALNKSTGRVTGTPTGPNSTASYTFKLAQPGLTTASRAVSLTVTDPPVPTPPTITTTSLPAGTVGQAYSTKLTASGNPAGTWSSSPLPAGLTLNGTTGVISGVPAAAGSTDVTVGFTQTSTGLAANPKALSIAIAPPPPPPAPVISTTALPDGTALMPYSFQLTALGNPPGTWSVTGLPTGYSVNASTGVISAPGLNLAQVKTYQVTINFTATGNPTKAVPVTLSLRVRPN